MQTIQETFRQAELRKGEKYTLLFTNDFCFPCVQKITLESIEETRYAQYDDAVRLIFRPCRKRNLYQKYFYGKSRFAILKGWYDIETSRKVTSAGGLVMTEICSGDFGFIDRACKDNPADVAVHYVYERAVQVVTEALVVRMIDGRSRVDVFPLKDLEKVFEVTGYTKDLSEERTHRIVRRAELDNRPILKGLVGPIWDGGRIRYEDEESHRILSA